MYVVLLRLLAKDHLISENSAHTRRKPYISGRTLNIHACPISLVVNIHVYPKVATRLHFSRVLHFLLLVLLSTIIYYWDYYTIRRKESKRETI